MRVRWSAGEDDQLRKLAITGLSLQEIASQMDRNKSSVRSRARTLNIAIARDRNGMVWLPKVPERLVELGLKAKK